MASETVRNQIRSGQEMSPEKENDLGSFCSCRAGSRTQTFDFQCRSLPSDNPEEAWSSRGGGLESTGHTPSGSTIYYELWVLGGPLKVYKPWTPRLRNWGTVRSAARTQCSLTCRPLSMAPGLSSTLKEERSFLNVPNPVSLAKGCPHCYRC